MAQDDEAGAVAAATYFLDLYTYTESTQDTGPWEAMSHDDCVFCQSVLDDVAAQAAAGHVARPATIRVASSSVEVLSPLAFNVALDITTGPDAMYSLRGELLSNTRKVEGTVAVIVMRQGEVWVTRGVSFEDPE